MTYQNPDVCGNKRRFSYLLLCSFLPISSVRSYGWTITNTLTTKRCAMTMKKPGGKKKVDLSTLTPVTDNSKWNEKVNAKRPTLGHVVPQAARDVMKKEISRKERQGETGGLKGKYRAQGKMRQDFKNNPANLRILGGSARGRKLDSPDVYLRPMMGKVREAVFSAFTAFGKYDAASLSDSTSVTTKCRHLDVFAGSGSVGLESLSRGATEAVFVDFAKNCCEAIERNIIKCDFEGQGQPVCCDALVALRDPTSVGITGTFQLITITPPYEEVVYADLLDAVAHSPLLDEDTIVLVEYPVELGCLPHVIGQGKLIGIRNRKYGRTVISMYIHRPTGKLDESAQSRPEEFVSLD